MARRAKQATAPTGNRFEFTGRELLESLPPAPAGKRKFYYDTRHRGLALQVTDAGGKAFYLYRWLRGRPERVKLGTFPETTVQQARAEAERIIGGIREGQEPADFRTRRHGEPTLGEWLEEFLTHKRNRRKQPLAERTKAGYRADFARYFAKLAARQLSQIEGADVARVHSSVGKRAPYAANRAVALVSSLYGYAGLRKVFTGPNPAAGIQHFPEEHRERTLGSDELPHLFRALAEDRSEFRDAFALALLTGARRGNVLAMRWADVNLERAEWRIPRTKGGTPQTVPLLPQAVELLAARARTSEYVFSSPAPKAQPDEPDKPLQSPRPTWLRLVKRAECYRIIGLLAEREGWKVREIEAARARVREKGAAAELARLRKRAKPYRLADGEGLASLRIHDLRHSVGGYLAAQNVSLATIMQTLGHKTASASLIYQKLASDPVREALRRATGAMLEHAGIAAGAQIVPLPKRRGARR
jgi:integrase